MIASRRLEFDAGHRLLAHKGKCQNYHGHRYVVEITVSAPYLDGVGCVMDFAEIKAKVGTWIDDNLDHGMILQQGDPMLPALQASHMKHYELAAPPTAENLAAHLATIAQGMLQTSENRVVVIAVRVYETPNCYAEWSV